MRTLSIINLKGGVAKTISAINIAYTLASVHQKRVLLIDNDKQGNTSKFFSVHSYDKLGISEVLTVKGFDVKTAIRSVISGKDGAPVLLDVLPANMTLLRANKEILLDCSWVQQTRLRKALLTVAEGYDYCVIDNAPDLNMSVINALVASDDVLIPIKIDKFAFDGLEQLLEQVDEVREFNAGITVQGCFATMVQQNNVNTQGLSWLEQHAGVPLLATAIRKTVRVDESTFAGAPLAVYAGSSTAAKDYKALTGEYLRRAEGQGV